ncbi:hypothetical protein Psi02_70780 [Planotetraspora silvatica]|uniref:Uncharacterized protein n=1 Tax=Planotetraspora silvatica TaxID=234614 RepID=A0A8J3UYA6_9ACTN|nr:hypothetical protein Psi02_70780 [Planotetraspora silvatica]
MNGGVSRVLTRPATGSFAMTTICASIMPAPPFPACPAGMGALDVTIFMAPTLGARPQGKPYEVLM